MPTDRWQRIEALVDAALALPPEQRSSFVEQNCEGDEKLRDDLLAMLAGAGTVTTLGNLIGEAAAMMGNEAAQNWAGRRIGSYRIIRILGKGGMGAVFLAVRDDDQFHKEVAIKTLKFEASTTFALLRFRQERQILAALEHPNIARLLDGGTTGEGTPYLVMEYIAGENIATYCRDRTLDLAARIELFCQVCDAVQYAHQKLVVHRDLKPGNILVTADGIPKLLDFGIAKLLDAGADRALETATGMLLMTPDYASPEQVRGEPISTATDVYALGAILYELLTGSRPHELKNYDPVEIAREVCETGIKAPSALGDRHLRGDLDNIVLKATSKDPARRYDSAGRLAEDLRRYLDGLPVLARPDTFAYRARKYVRRHWLGVAAGAALAVALGGGIASSLYQAHRAQQRFEEVRSLAHTFLFDLHDDVARLDGSTAVREKMVRTALLYLDSLSKNAGGDRGLQKELAAAYQKVGDAQGYPARPSLGRTRDAVASYRRAAEIHEAAARRDPAYRLTLGPFYTDFGNLLRYQGAYDEARRTAENARDILEQVTQAHPDDGRAQRTLAASWCLLGDIDEERFHNSRAFENFSKCDALADQVLKRWPDRDSLEMAEHARARVGTSSNTVGHLKEALAAFDDDEKLLAEMALREPSNPRFKRAAAVLAQFRSTVYYDDDTPNLGDPAECLKYSRIYLDNARRMVETDPNNASARLSLAIALFRLSFPLKDIDAKAAVESAKESARIFDELIAAGKNSFLVTSRRARALRRLSEASIAAGRNAEARKIVSEALSAQRSIASHDQNDLREANLLALTLVDSAAAAESPEMAAAMLREAEQISTSVFEKDREDLTSIIPLARVREELAKLARKTGNEAQARNWSDRAQQLWLDFPEQNEYVRGHIRAR